MIIIDRPKSWVNKDGVEIEIVEEQELLLPQKDKEFPIFKYLNRKIKNRISVYADLLHFKANEKMPLLFYIFSKDNIDYSKEYITEKAMTVVHIIELMYLLSFLFGIVCPSIRFFITSSILKQPSKVDYLSFSSVVFCVLSLLGIAVYFWDCRKRNTAQ